MITLQTIKSVLRTAVNAVVPTSYYRPAFKPGDVLESAYDERSDVPRLPGDTLYSIMAGGKVRIERITYGKYVYNDDRNPTASAFKHGSGSPHYEVYVLGNRTLLNNWTSYFDGEGSLIHLPAQMVEERFRLLPSIGTKAA
jgi:hypothetical protein